MQDYLVDGGVFTAGSDKWIESSSSPSVVGGEFHGPNLGSALSEFCTVTEIEQSHYRVVFKDEYVRTVFFNPQNGSPVWGLECGVMCVIKKPADPVREGYLFSGWFED